MLLRWLLPIVAAIALLGNAAAAFAAAGTFGHSKCCCPSPKVCKCHDHDKPKHDEQLRRCSGDAVKVTPVLQVTVIPEPIETVALMAEVEIEHASTLVPDQFVTEPEKPPF